ncbi:CysB family HTH-type transcriptional regulator [Hyphomicrobium sp.]|uniref:CysB family HTH-type transcriptional regulator n=1 Tax=Hyphomicrobium sp. TaxID=82 RepID=UPI002BC803BC|nr:CysB family HTH-type transcriptional regulator [Hyphomicrobium sp.]HRN88698.1 CysB family HTH-type transcriptional regulator [Hyphomicrobium sp.]HRQ25853.1 CysB family HTH-type transcriptional regulator [Hyphomicrobium sp.]
MNFQQLRIIRETVRQRFNLTEAANVLLTSQSGVSKHIRDLEDELGFEIFVRRGKRLLGLTDPGREVAAVIERILLETQNLEELSSSIAQRACGTLVIATTHTQARYSLPGVIAEFKKAFPDVRLTLKQLSPKDIASVLLEGLADVGIATDTLEHNPQILTFPFYSWEHVIIVPKSHPLARRKKVTLEDIAPYPIITYDEGLTGRARIDDAFQKASLVADVAMTALDADVIKAYVELGMGVGIIASMAFDEERDTNLTRIVTPGLFESNTSSIAVRRGRFLRGYVYRFIEMCAPDITEAHVRTADRTASP